MREWEVKTLSTFMALTATGASQEGRAQLMNAASAVSMRKSNDETDTPPAEKEPAIGSFETLVGSFGRRP